MKTKNWLGSSLLFAVVLMTAALAMPTTAKAQTDNPDDWDDEFAPETPSTYDPGHPTADTPPSTNGDALDAFFAYWAVVSSSDIFFDYWTTFLFD